MQNFFAARTENGIIRLDENESAHAVKVLRLREGDLIRVFDGQGNIFRARISKAHARHTEAVAEEKEHLSARAPWHLHLAVAPTKSMERFEFFLEKVTETGVDEITPLLCERSERKKLRYDRLERLLIAAMKQSMQPFLPRLHPFTPLKDFLAAPPAGDRLIAHCCENEDPQRGHLYESITSPHVTILIGPEGDFSPQEIEEARRAGYRTISLGNTRLRSETAGIAAAIITAARFRMPEKGTQT